MVRLMHACHALATLSLSRAGALCQAKAAPTPGARPLSKTTMMFYSLPFGVGAKAVLCRCCWAVKPVLCPRAHVLALSGVL